MGVKQLLYNIKKGKDGKNVGIPTGLLKLNKVIYGIQRKCLITIGADSGSGKTSFAVDQFVYELIKNKGDNPVNILYYSFEMSGDILYAKILSLYIYDTFNKVITYETILSLLQPISDENYEYIKKSEEWLFKLQESFTIYDKALTPSGIYATSKNWLKEFGEFIEINEHKEDYREYDSQQYKVILIDHVGLIAGSDSKKVKIDTVADYMIYFRNKCNITGIFIQQLNRNSKSMDRKTNGYELVGIEDFKDSSGTTDASEIVLALFYPYREKIARCENYPIQNVLKHRFRLLEVLKNRYGKADINIGCTFHGEIGLFKELPKPEKIGDYAPYLELDYKEEKQIDNIENQFIII